MEGCDGGRESRPDGAILEDLRLCDKLRDYIRQVFSDTVEQSILVFPEKLRSQSL